MNVGWFDSGAVTPPRKRKVLFYSILWIPAVYGGLQERTVEEGGENPLPRTAWKKNPSRRGCRGGRRRRRLTAAAPVHPKPRREGPVVERGTGSRARRFVAAFNRSVEAAIPTAKQIADIKHRAEARRSVNRVPLPPKAAQGLHWRQRRLVRLSRHWGLAWSRATGESVSAGRRYWRGLLYRKVGSSQGLSKTEVFGPSESSAPTAKRTLVAGDRRPAGVAPSGRLFWECFKCGNGGLVDPSWPLLARCPRGGCKSTNISVIRGPSVGVPKGWHR
jgi:hypothetical protein